jgi:hypothetical protein
VSSTFLASPLNLGPVFLRWMSTAHRSSMRGSGSDSRTTSFVPVLTECTVKSYAERSAQPTHSIQPYELRISQSQQSAA